MFGHNLVVLCDQVLNGSAPPRWVESPMLVEVARKKLLNVQYVNPLQNVELLDQSPR